MKAVISLLTMEEEDLSSIGVCVCVCACPDAFIYVDICVVCVFMGKHSLKGKMIILILGFSDNHQQNVSFKKKEYKG